MQSRSWSRFVEIKLLSKQELDFEDVVKKRVKVNVEKDIEEKAFKYNETLIAGSHEVSCQYLQKKYL